MIKSESARTLCSFVFVHISAPGQLGVQASINFLQFQTISEDGDENKNGKIAESQLIRF
jgi:hypothetical protein